MLFSGTLRVNLDPWDKHTDVRLWQVPHSYVSYDEGLALTCHETCTAICTRLLWVILP